MVLIMKPKVIKTERDYRATLAHVETLMDKSSPDEPSRGSEPSRG